MEFNLFLFLIIVSAVHGSIFLEINNKYRALDEALYEEVLDAEQCHEQIRYIRRNAGLQIRFVDAGIRTPRGVAQGNFVDMGNYQQCLGITHETEEMSIQGKYCTIAVPLSQDWSLPWNDLQGFDPRVLDVDEELKAKVEDAYLQRSKMMTAVGVMNGEMSRARASETSQFGLTFNLAVCIPKPCSTQQALTSFLFNVTAFGFRYEDGFCRLPDDKPWSPADTVATVIFSLIGLLTVLCTAYDLIYTKILKKDPKQASRLYTSFSVYTNGRRLMNFSSTPGTLHCLDGIRTWAMMWVVIGHSFSTEVFLANITEMLQWLTRIESLWIMSATITVDTFFTIAGLLLVYTTAGKMNGVQLLKNLPLFYINRLLRLFPLLATAVLLQASFFNRMYDGPYWQEVENQTNYCRNHWWWTLLYVQNYVGVGNMCIPHSWYIAIDVQLYIVSPLVLFWVLGKNRKVAWAALVGGVLASVTVGTVYSFVNNWPSGTIVFNRPDIVDYYYYYYFNTLTRASPFFVGMFFGYLLHVCRNTKIELSWITVASLWTISATVSTTIFFYKHFIIQPDWDNQTVDNVMNSFMRPAWAATICWMVFACTHGYGGPVNWFLTLDIWKLPSRVSYAIFIFHYPLQFVINGAALSPTYFSVPGFTFKGLAQIAVALLAGYFFTLLIDAPCSTLIKMLLDSVKKQPARQKQTDKEASPQTKSSNKLEENPQINNKGNGDDEHDNVSTKQNGDFEKALKEDDSNNSNKVDKNTIDIDDSCTNK